MEPIGFFETSVRITATGCIMAQKRAVLRICNCLSKMKALSLCMLSRLAFSLSLFLSVFRDNINGGEHSPGLPSPANEYWIVP